MAKRADRTLIVGLDIGTSKVVALVGEVAPDGSIEVIGLGSQPSRGLKKGVVVNIESTVQSIQRAIEEAELMAGCEIHSVFAGIAGSHIRSLNSHGIVAIRDREVSQHDVVHVIDAAKAVAIPADQKILHVLPQEFIIDGQEGIRDPIGMSGVRLEAKVHIVTGADSAAQNIEKCIQRCGLEVDDVVPSSSLELSTLTDDEKELGVCLVDIGGGTTDLAVFSSGAIRHTAVIPIAGDQVTNDIAVSMRTPTHYAEDIKVRYACALSQLANPDESIEVPSVGDRPARRLARQTLAEIVEPRYEELFGLVRDELRHSGFEEAIAAGIVLTGGSAKMEGAIELAEEVFHVPVRLGLPQQVQGLTDVVRNPIYSTAVGLLLYARDNRWQTGPLGRQRRCSRMKRFAEISMLDGDEGREFAQRSPFLPRSDEMFELMDAYSQSAVIKVLGVGGGGGNAVAHMVAAGIEGVEFLCINTDAQALKHSKVKTALQIGANMTKGLGAGADPEVGRQAAMEDRDRIIEMIEGCDMLFITAGMGGGTGTGAAPVVAQVAKELGILTVAVVTKPFEMEGGKRMLVAEHGMAELGKYVDSLITIPNQKLLTVLGPQITLLDAFKSANQVLQGAVQGIAELITRPGLINVDFADVRTVMSETGMAMMGSGSASGENRAREAAEAAVSSPLREDIHLSGAHGVLVNVTAGMDLSIGEFQEVGSIVKQYASEDATVVVGTVIDPELTNEIRVTVVATGLGRMSAAPAARPRDLAREVAARAEPSMRVVRRSPLGSADYTALDRPTVQRQRAVGDGLRADTEAEDILDIPAFLRRQAD